MLVYAIVSAVAPEEAVRRLHTPRGAERFLDDVRADEPDLAELLSIEPIEFGDSAAVSPPN